jgi:hypothetical protein
MSNVIIITEYETQIIAVAEQGPPGVSGTASPLLVTADTAIGGHRAVVATSTGCSYADNTNIQHINKVIGVTNGAASQGASASIAIHGQTITEPSWSFSEGPVWLGQNGLITQELPSSGFLQQVAIALSQTKIIVNIGTPLKL